MRITSVLLLGISLLFLAFERAPGPIDLDKAKELGLKWSVAGNDNSTHYDFPLQLDLANQGDRSVEIRIPTGSIFHPSDSEYQDIVIGEEYIVRIDPGENKRIDLKGYCTESGDMGPQGETVYGLGQSTNSSLTGLLNFISDEEMHGMEAQQAVWTLVENGDLREIAAYNEEYRSAIVDWMAEELGIEPPPPPSEDDYKRNYQAPVRKKRVGGSFSFEFPYRANFRIAMFNSRNTVVRELMPETSMSPGFHEFPFEFDATYFEEDIYSFKLIADGETLVVRRLDLRRN
jgi:hypothetical protein